jgi:hypothetical protein
MIFLLTAACVEVVQQLRRLAGRVSQRKTTSDISAVDIGFLEDKVTVVHASVSVFQFSLINSFSTNVPHPFMHYPLTDIKPITGRNSRHSLTPLTENKEMQYTWQDDLSISINN